MTDNQNLPVVSFKEAVDKLISQQTPESKAIISYIEQLRKKDIAVLGTDEAFVLRDNDGQIKAFKKALTLSAQDGTLIQPLGYGDYIVSAQGYEAWAEATGTSVIFPKEVLVGNDWKPNPYAERDQENRRILAVHARAIAFRYSSMGIPQVSDWTTIFDTPSYRMIDLLAKAKKFPQAFKVLPKEMKPAESQEGKPLETWASYPFDESMNLWINTSHNEVITWLSQILNREKKAMDFAQTFAKRNSLKHLSGIQKVPNWQNTKDGPNQWRFPVLAWRPTGNNIVKWDYAQYANLQDRVVGMIEGSGSDEFRNKIEIKKGVERTSEDENMSALEMEVDPEDVTENHEQTKDQDSNNVKVGDIDPELKNMEMTKMLKNTAYLKDAFPEIFEQALAFFGISEPVEKWHPKQHVEVYQKVSELVDAQN